MRHLPSVRSLAALPLAALLAVGVAVVPPAAAPVVPFLAPVLAPFDAPVARAAGGLSLTTAARYVVMPDADAVRVTIDVTVRNDKPNRVAGGVITRYFYDAVNLGVQPEAVRFRATQGGVALRVDAARKTGYKLVTVNLRANVFYQQTAGFRLVYDLPAGAPRSASDVRVGKAFATFLAWAFGDTGTVRIEVPAPFTVDVAGEDVERTTEGGSTVLTASTSDPLAWYAWVNARNDAGLTREQLDIAGGEQIVVRGWPEDARWRTEVGDVLTRGVPQLVDRIGLPWPVDGALNVIEIHTPLLEGYAGFYDTASGEITVSEDLDDLTIVHEASHAWFNNSLFTERWITEGLADEYASQVLGALGQPAPGPKDVSRDSAVAFALNNWPPPAPIADQQSSAREQYGYDASWYVIRQVVDAVGEDRMRAVFKAASDQTIAYIGAGPPERTALPGDWRRFLDLTEELGGATSVGDLLATWALPAGSDAELRAREQARSAYHSLAVAERGWAAPYAVRSPLDRWAFDDAEARIADATRILEQRDRTASLASAQGLTPSGDLETAYETAVDVGALAKAQTLADETEASLETIAAASETAAEPRDFFVSLGIDGTDPDGDVAAARHAWSSGDLGTATQRATQASTALAAAPEAGRRRALVLGVAIGALVLLLIVALFLVRRRSRRRGGGPGMPPAGPGGPDPYATLPASAAPGAEPVIPPFEDEGAEPS